MRPRRAALLTPPSPTLAFLQNVANSCICHTSENSPVTPIIATDPKMRSRKSCVCHTCDPLPPPPFHFSSSFSRHESLATSKFPRSWSQICPFIFRQLQDAPPATLFFSCFCMVAGGWVGASPEGMLPSAQCSLSRTPAQSLHLRSPHLRFPTSRARSLRNRQSGDSPRKNPRDGQEETFPERRWTNPEACGGMR